MSLITRTKCKHEYFSHGLYHISELIFRQLPLNNYDAVLLLTLVIFLKVMQIKMLKYPAADRNKQFILNELIKYIKDGSVILEISSGTGQHVTHFAQHLPNAKFQPTECDETLIRSIKSYVEHCKLSNVHEAAYLDVLTDPCMWLNGKLTAGSIDGVININMIHITPIECCEGLFRGCGYYLKPHGLVFLYGPFAYDGIISFQSNVNFDESLRSCNPLWGLRDVNRQLVKIAAKYHIQLHARHKLPSNNDLLVWKKDGS